MQLTFPQLKTNKHSLKDPKSGKYVSKKPPWDTPGSSGFWNFIKKIKPRIISQNKYILWTPTQKQKEVINNALAVDSEGKFKHSISLSIQPRRFGKSTSFCLILIFLFFSRKNFTIHLLGVTEQHSRRTQLNTIKGIIQNTPSLSRLIPEKNFQIYEIKHPSKNNRIQMSAGSSTATAYGDRIDLLYLSDFHNFMDLQPWYSFQSALLDSSESLILIDSNIDFVDGHVHALQRESKHDDSIFTDHLFFKDIDDYMKRVPKLAPWINLKRAKRQQRTSLEVDWKRDLLGQRSDAKNALFPEEIRNLCRVDYKIPVADLSSLTQGRAYKVGAGLDRAKSLSPAFGSDSTVLSIVLKCASPKHGEPMFYLLDMVIFPLNTSRLIKKAILKAHEAYHIDNIVLENYEITDLAPWLSDMKIPYEIVNATDTAQNSAFPEMYRIFSESRFNYPKDLKRFDSELSTFTYTQRKGGKGYSFGHASQKFHDDTVYSTAWAIYSLRTAIMNLYVLGSFYCQNKSRRRLMCYLMGSGDKELLCKESCLAHAEVEGMFREYKTHQLDSELTLPEFFFDKIKHIGCRISQAL